MTTRYGGPRSEHFTVLMPSAMAEDLEALRMATGQSTNDLINELLDARLSSCGEDLRIGREMLRLRAERSGRKEAREAEAMEPEPSEDATAMPDDAFIDAWAEASEKKPLKAARFGKQYTEWCKAGGRPFMASSKEFAAEILAKEFSVETVLTYRRMVDRMIAAWGGRA